MAVLLTGSSPGVAAPSADKMNERCQRGRHPVSPPKELLAARGIRLENACPVQTRLDENHECQDAATVLQNVYEILVEERAKTCQKAAIAAREAQQNCRGQQACLQAQAAALKAYEEALAAELSTVQSYRSTISMSAGYAVEQIAGEGANLLRGLLTERDQPDDGTRRYGPQGRGLAAAWLKAKTNKEAHETIFRGDDPVKAATVVERLMTAEGTESDISGIRSDLIREPLRIAIAGRSWNREIASYEQELRASSEAMNHQRSRLSGDAKKLGSEKEPATPAGRRGTITASKPGSSNSVASAPGSAGTSGFSPSGSGTSAGALSEIPGFASAAGSLAAQFAGTGNGGAGVKDGSPRLPAASLAGQLGKPGFRGSDAGPDSLSAERSSASPLPPADDPKNEANGGGKEKRPMKSGLTLNLLPGAAGESGGTGSSASAKALRAKVPGSGVEDEASGPGTGLAANGPAGQDSAEPPRAETDTGDPAFAGGGDGFGEASAPGNNEIAVEGLVKRWEARLEQSAEPPELSAGIAPAEGRNLFQRAHEMHVRALRKGILSGTLRTRL